MSSNNIYLCTQAIQDTRKDIRLNNQAETSDSTMKSLKLIMVVSSPGNDAKDSLSNFQLT